MSYILDALKRAEAERSRGEIPGLLTQPARLAPRGAGPSARTPVFAAALMAAVVVLGLAWWWLSDDASAPLAPALLAPAPVAVEPPAAAVPPPMAIAPVPPPDPASPALSVEVVPPAPSAAPVAKRPPHQTSPRPVANKPPARRQPTPGAEALGAPPSGGQAAPPGGATESRIFALSELPIDIRGALPPLVVGGASHSEHAASRMLILNGQIHHEGDRLTAELTLQQIQLRSAVLSFRGYRFSISY
jgi:general secretion pathway protein B